MFNLLNEIKKLSEDDAKHKDVFQQITKTIEELGEFATEVLIEDKVHGNTYKEVDEGSITEAVDVMIMAMCLYFTRGGTVEIFEALMQKKVNKWRAKKTQ